MRRRWLSGLIKEYPDRITAVGFDQADRRCPGSTIDCKQYILWLEPRLQQPRDASREAPDGLQRLSPALVAGRLCYDLSYGEQAHFARWAQAQGALLSADGLGMLVEQAAESYRIWLGCRPDTESVYASLRHKTS